MDSLSSSNRTRLGKLLLGVTVLKLGISIFERIKAKKTFAVFTPAYWEGTESEKRLQELIDQRDSKETNYRLEKLLKEGKKLKKVTKKFLPVFEVYFLRNKIPESLIKKTKNVDKVE